MCVNKSQILFKNVENWCKTPKRGQKDVTNIWQCWTLNAFSTKMTLYTLQQK